MTEFNDFRGAAKKLDDIDFPKVGSRIGVGEDELHAFLEVESKGRGYDDYGRPLILYEPHVFYRNLPQEKKQQAIMARLASPKWGTIPYGKQSAQYGKLHKAMEIDQEAALKACSWGLTQILGENFKQVGYDTIDEMVLAFMDDEENHLEACVQFLIVNNIDDDLRNHRWSTVARVYNGPGYKKNNYDSRMAEAYKKWSHIADTPWSPEMAPPDEPAKPPPTDEDLDEPWKPPPAKIKPGTWPEDNLARFQIRSIQQRLRDLGYFIVGRVDGIWGDRTTAAISALQRRARITVDGHWGPQTQKALADDRNKKLISLGRAATDVDDLRKDGVIEIVEADKIKEEAKEIDLAARTAAVSAIVLIATEIVTRYIAPATDLLAPVKDKFAAVPADVWYVVTILVAFWLWRKAQAQATAAKAIQASRLHDERLGLHNSIGHDETTVLTEEASDAYAETGT